MLELEHRFRVVDVHARLPIEEPVTARGRAISPDKLERELHQAGVVSAVVFPGPQEGNSYLRANNAVARRPARPERKRHGPTQELRVASERMAHFL